jgi:hypothetical protein
VDVGLTLSRRRRSVQLTSRPLVTMCGSPSVATGSRHRTLLADAGGGGHHTTVDSLFFIAYPQTPTLLLVFCLFSLLPRWLPLLPRRSAGGSAVATPTSAVSSPTYSPVNPHQCDACGYCPITEVDKATQTDPLVFPFENKLVVLPPFVFPHGVKWSL